MRGGIFHEHMIDVLEKTFKKRGFQTRRQVPSRKGRKGGYIDLLVSNNDDSVFLIIEVEMRKTRVLNDIQKQKDFGNGATLWIVSPTGWIAVEIKDCLKGHGVEEDETLFVLSLSDAIKRVMNKFPIFISP